jgi:hypothetical protein
MFLPDINVWLALAFDTHVHHPLANAWFIGETAASFGFCRQTQQGFLRLATNPSVLGADAVSMKEAWSLYDTIRRDSRIVFVDEPPELEAIWRSLTDEVQFSPKVWNDAYLAAFAIAGELELATLDRGIARYSQLSCKVLK